MTAVLRRNETGRRCSERQRVFCAREPVDGGRSDGGAAEKRKRPAVFGAAAGFFVFGYRSVPFDRAVRFLWGVYCRRRRGLCVRESDDGSRSDRGDAKKQNRPAVFGAAAGFFVFGYRSVPFDRAVRFLWGVYCRRRRGLCVRVSDDGSRRDCGGAKKQNRPVLPGVSFLLLPSGVFFLIFQANI